MMNSAPTNYQLPELFISDLLIGQQPVRREPEQAELDNIDLLLAEELLSDLVPTKPVRRAFN